MKLFAYQLRNATLRRLAGRQSMSGRPILFKLIVAAAARRGIAPLPQFKMRKTGETNIINFLK
jgi:hypothetical protein